MKHSNDDRKDDDYDKSEISNKAGDNLTEFYINENRKHSERTENDLFDNQVEEGCDGIKNENLNVKRMQKTESYNEQFLQNLYHVQVYRLLEFSKENFEI